MKKSPALFVAISCVFGMLSFIAAVPELHGADIYRWRDESGVVHYTDTPSNIPERYRSRKETVQRGPADGGRPSLSTIGAPPSGPSATPPPEPFPVTDPARPGRDGGSPEETEKLRARIEAKERFVEGIDRKRSHALNPLGNRFVSPEDLELYKKYSEELPKDRKRLAELEQGAP
jgi:hypothetical protein